MGWPSSIMLKSVITCVYNAKKNSETCSITSIMPKNAYVAFLYIEFGNKFDVVMTSPGSCTILMHGHPAQKIIVVLVDLWGLMNLIYY